LDLATFTLDLDEPNGDQARGVASAFKFSDQPSVLRFDSGVKIKPMFDYRVFQAQEG
jgi:hypothetical protein